MRSREWPNGWLGGMSLAQRDSVYDYWSDEALLSDGALAGRAKLVHSNVVPFAPKTRFIKGGDTVASGIEAVASHGHTPGHTSYHLESQGRRLLILGDVCNHYVIPTARNPDSSGGRTHRSSLPPGGHHRAAPSLPQEGALAVSSQAHPA